MVARYYIGFGDVEQQQLWITSGFATFMSDASQLAGDHEPADWWGCAKADTLAALENLDIDQEGIGECHLAMGNRFMHALHDALGDEATRRGLRNLYLKSLQDDTADDCQGIDLTICHLEAAFKASASDSIAAKVDAVLDRWYGPRP